MGTVLGRLEKRAFGRSNGFKDDLNRWPQRKQRRNEGLVVGTVLDSWEKLAVATEPVG